ncbi:uncharacterized protein LOC144709482 isoform X2 [Wolffia australiana]
MEHRHGSPFNPYNYYLASGPSRLQSQVSFNPPPTPPSPLPTPASHQRFLYPPSPHHHSYYPSPERAPPPLPSSSIRVSERTLVHGGGERVLGGFHQQEWGKRDSTAWKRPRLEEELPREMGSWASSDSRLHQSGYLGSSYVYGAERREPAASHHLPYQGSNLRSSSSTSTSYFSSWSHLPDVKSRCSPRTSQQCKPTVSSRSSVAKNNTWNRNHVEQLRVKSGREMDLDISIESGVLRAKKNVVIPPPSNKGKLRSKIEGKISSKCLNGGEKMKVSLSSDQKSSSQVDGEIVALRKVKEEQILIVGNPVGEISTKEVAKSEEVYAEKLSAVGVREEEKLEKAENQEEAVEKSLADPLVSVGVEVEEGEIIAEKQNGNADDKIDFPVIGLKPDELNEDKAGNEFDISGIGSKSDELNDGKAGHKLDLSVIESKPDESSNGKCGNGIHITMIGLKTDELSNGKAVNEPCFSVIGLKSDELNDGKAENKSDISAVVKKSDELSSTSVAPKLSKWARRKMRKRLAAALNPVASEKSSVPSAQSSQVQASDSQQEQDNVEVECANAQSVFLLKELPAGNSSSPTLSNIRDTDTEKGILLEEGEVNRIVAHKISEQVLVEKLSSFDSALSLNSELSSAANVVEISSLLPSPEDKGLLEKEAMAMEKSNDMGRNFDGKVVDAFLMKSDELKSTVETPKLSKSARKKMRKRLASSLILVASEKGTVSSVQSSQLHVLNAQPKQEHAEVGIKELPAGNSSTPTLNNMRDSCGDHLKQASMSEQVPVDIISAFASVRSSESELNSGANGVEVSLLLGKEAIVSEKTNAKEEDLVSVTVDEAERNEQDGDGKAVDKFVMKSDELNSTSYIPILPNFARRKINKRKAASLSPVDCEKGTVPSAQNFQPHGSNSETTHDHAEDEMNRSQFAAAASLKLLPAEDSSSTILNDMQYNTVKITESSSDGKEIVQMDINESSSHLTQEVCDVIKGSSAVKPQGLHGPSQSVFHSHTCDGFATESKELDRLFSFGVVPDKISGDKYSEFELSGTLKSRKKGRKNKSNKLNSSVVSSANSNEPTVVLDELEPNFTGFHTQISQIQMSNSDINQAETPRLKITLYRDSSSSTSNNLGVRTKSVLNPEGEECSRSVRLLEGRLIISDANGSSYASPLLSSHPRHDLGKGNLKSLTGEGDDNSLTSSYQVTQNSAGTIGNAEFNDGDKVMRAQMLEKTSISGKELQHVCQKERNDRKFEQSIHLTPDPTKPDQLLPSVYSPKQAKAAMPDLFGGNNGSQATTEEKMINGSEIRNDRMSDKVVSSDVKPLLSTKSRPKETKMVEASAGSGIASRGRSDTLLLSGTNSRTATEAELQRVSAKERLSVRIPHQRSQLASTFNCRRPNTWRRTENPVVPPVMVKLSSSDPVIVPSPNVLPNIQSSYVRKGNSLIRKPSLTAPPINSCTEEIAINLASGPGKCLNINMKRTSMATNSLLEKPKTPPVPGSEEIALFSGEGQQLSEPNEGARADNLPDNDHTFSEKETSHVKDSSSGLADGALVSTTKETAASSLAPLVSNYRRIKNKLIRDSSSLHMNSSSGASRDLKQATSASKSSRFSLVWTLNREEPANLEIHNPSKRRKILPYPFPWKRVAYLGDVFTRKTYLEKHPSLLTRKLQLLRWKSAPSSNRRARGVYSLKWSKSMEKRSKKEAIPVISEHQLKENSEGKISTDLLAEKSAGSHCNLASGERIFRVGTIRYKMDPSRRTLIRIPDGQKTPACKRHPVFKGKTPVVPRRLSIGNEEYVRVGNGNQLVRDPKKLVRILASEKIRWSLHTARRKFARKQRYCQFFTRFGQCNKEEGKCPYIHDPTKIAICTKFLKGLCFEPNCKLTHKVIPERMPDCSYFLEGLCTNSNCAYRHVNVNPKASVCEGFLKGYCRDGDECRKKHSYVCPQFEASGNCPRGTACKLHHKKSGRTTKAKRLWTEENHTRGRYFGVVTDETENPQPFLSTSLGLVDKGEGDIFFQEGRFTEFINLAEDDDDNDDDDDDSDGDDGNDDNEDDEEGIIKPSASKVLSCLLAHRLPSDEDSLFKPLRIMSR